MRLIIIIPNFIKSILKPIYRIFIHSRFYKKITYSPKCRDELHQYWKHPSGNYNSPQKYLEGEMRSQFLVRIIKKYTNPKSNILEIGCNVGRNLNYLFSAGFKKLSGIDINKSAIQLLRKSYPEMADYAKIYNLPIEEIIKELKYREFDIVFTMAVLEHIHKDSEWIFPEIVRISKKYLITIEDERGLSWRHFPRNYKSIFESLGMKQVEEINCNKIEGLNSDYFLRIFKHHEK